MKIVRELSDLFSFEPLEISSPVVFSLGVFDGVHLGHQFLLREAKRFAPKKLVLLSFADAPKVLLSGKGSVRVTSLDHKEELLSSHGVDLLLHLFFTEDIQSLSAPQFLELINRVLPISRYVVGQDVSFGKERMGNLDFLEKEAKRRGQAVSCVEKVEGISSSCIRANINAANFKEVSKMLGRPYSIKVMGRRNEQGVFLIEASSLCLPPDGIYSVFLPSQARQVNLKIQGKRLFLEAPFLQPQHSFFEIVFSVKALDF